MKTITLTAIDIGTYAVLGVSVRRDLNTGAVEVLAKAQQKCFGVRNGEVDKPNDVAQAVFQVRQALEEQSGLKIKEAITNISGSRLFSVGSQGLVSVSRADQKISSEDIDRVLRAAQAVSLPSNKNILETLPREFIVDGEGGIKEPLGLQGVRLEAKVLLVCMFTPIMENVHKTLSTAGLEVLGVMPSPLATSRAVLSEEQKEVGVAMIDMGAGTTSLSVFEKGNLVNFVVFPAGSANITNDIAIGLRTEIATAESIKRQFGSLMPALDKASVVNKKASSKKEQAKDNIELPEKDLVFPKSFLNDIVEARVSQLFTESEKALKKITSIETLPAGVVLTGGGANMPGIVDFAKQKFNLPCSLGVIAEIPSIESPEFSTAAGLALCGFDNENMGHNVGAGTDSFRRPTANFLKKIFRAFLP